MDENTRQDMKKSIETHIEVLNTTTKQMHEVIEMYDKIPPMTNKLIRAKRKFIKKITRFVMWILRFTRAKQLVSLEQMVQVSLQFSMHLLVYISRLKIVSGRTSNSLISSFQPP